MKFALLVCFYCFQLIPLKAQQWFVGINGGVHWNISTRNIEDQSLKWVQHQKSLAFGVCAGRIPENRFGFDASVNFYNATYVVNYKSANSEFLDAELHFTSYHFHLNYYLNRDAEIRPYFYVGPQILQRRWGTERYKNQILDGTYWPQWRTNIQAGFGVLIHSGSWSVIPQVGIRINPSNDLVYDRKSDQYFLGCSFVKNFHIKKKNPYNKCPNNF
ncbi:MAG: outer membrane beta-barrel protein [Bacteroidetes bacterium]|nr:outer membrane beta-barrel protein [Bacteroidota bacterium]